MVKRVIRSVWVLATNGFVIWLVYKLFFAEVTVPEAPVPGQVSHRGLKFLIAAALPILGIVLELAGLKFARWVNILCLVTVDCFWLAMVIGSWPYTRERLGLSVGVALGLATIPGVTEIIYRMTRGDFSRSA